MNSDFRVGPWLVQPSLNTISQNGTSNRLEPKMMGVLVCLAEHTGEVVPKERLLQVVWPDTFVSDDVLKRSVSELRRVLGDDAHDSRIIETIPKRGYRLVVPVQSTKRIASLPSDPSGTAVACTERALSKRVRRMGRVIVIGLLFALLIFVLRPAELWQKLATTPDVYRVRSIAVLPLRNFSGDSDQDYFADGLTDELITRLAQLGEVRVVSRTSIMHYKNTQKTIPEIARELNVDAVLEGAVLRSGNRIRITAELIRAGTDQHLWAESYERDLRDVIALQADISKNIARRIGVHMTSAERSNLDNAASVEPAAHNAYLKGRFYWAKHTESGMRNAVTSFQEAVKLDPKYSPAYSGLALAYQELAYYVQPSEVIPRAREAASSAIGLDQCNAEAYTVLGWIKLHYDWDFPGAESEYMRAIQCDSGSSEPHDELATYLDTMGRFDEALREHRIALASDPLSFLARVHYGDSLFYARRYDQAQKEYEDVLHLEPNFVEGHRALGWLYLQKGEFQSAIKELKNVVELDPGSGTLVPVSYAMAGNRVLAKKMAP